MAFRGRGRGGRFGGGRFGGGGGLCRAEKIKFELFPEIENLSDVQSVKEEQVFVFWSHRLQMLWKLSPYYYKGVGNDAEGRESIDIERYSAKNSTKTWRKPSLSDCIKMTDEYVPAELAVKHQRGRKRVRWNQESDMQKFVTDMQKLDIFEKLEKKFKTENDKKEGDAAEEEDEIVEEEDEGEFSDDGDYEQNQDFDDDEDDYNMADDNDDGPYF